MTITLASRVIARAKQNTRHVQTSLARGSLPLMKRPKPQPRPTNAPEPPVGTVGSGYGAGFGAWFMANVRREIAAGRVRTTIDKDGKRHAIN